MKSILALVVFVLSIATTAAFPSKAFDIHLSEKDKRAVAAVVSSIETQNRETRSIPFDAAAQYVSTTGDHAFIPPGPGDLRGPCPGLNAAANHNYIPRNGIGTTSQFIAGTFEAYGMGADLAGILSIIASVLSGDLVSWSIGGPPPTSLLSLTAGLLGTPQGLIGSHNKYEADVSPTRGDLYEYGNNYKVLLSQFTDLYTQPLGPRGYDLSTLTPFRHKRFQQSISSNPYFFNGPVSGVLVQPAAYTFMYKYMANKSTLYPDGYLSGDILKSFFSITGSSSENFVYTEGHERIPENFYKRAVGDEYGLAAFLPDLLAAAAQYPEFLSIGGNTGKVNTFTGVDISDLTGGVFHSETLAKGNNLACMVFQFMEAVTPDLVKGLFASLTKPLDELDGAVGGILGNLTCPQLKGIDWSLLEQFPGSMGAV